MRKKSRGMSDEPPRKPGKIVIYGLVVLALGLAVLVFQKLDLHGTRLPPTAINRGPERQTDGAVADLQETLRKEPGLVGCRDIVAQLNRRKTSPIAWSAAEGEFVRKEFHLDDGDLAEISSTATRRSMYITSTSALLLHDAARSLGVDALPARNRAMAGFAWTMRQVCARPMSRPARRAFVLRRGWEPTANGRWFFWRCSTSLVFRLHDRRARRGQLPRLAARCFVRGANLPV